MARLKIWNDTEGEWQYVVSPPSGGSQPGTVRRLDLGVVDAALLANGPVTLYTPDAGEVVGPVTFRDVTLPAIQIVVGRDETVLDDSNNPPLAKLTQNGADDSFALGAAGDDLRLVPTTVGPVTAGYADSETGNPNAYPWQANHVYDGSYGAEVSGQMVIEAGHLWTADPTGTSGGSQPDFAGNIGGTVADGDDIIWTDTGVADGSVHVYADAATPVAP